MPARLLLAALLLAALSLPGCGGGDDDSAALPAACADGANAYLGALERAPGKVTLGGGPTISECVRRSRGSAELAAMEAAMVAAAGELNEDARAAGGGKPAVALGYLLGAVRTAAQETGAHARLVRRLLVASRFEPGGEPLLPPLIVAFGAGFDAGHANG